MLYTLDTFIFFVCPVKQICHVSLAKLNWIFNGKVSVAGLNKCRAMFEEVVEVKLGICLKISGRIKSPEYV